VALPGPLREYAGLDREVVVLGVSDRLEVWDAAAWSAVSDQADELYADIEEALTEEGI
jgi:MraZ protein